MVMVEVVVAKVDSFISILAYEDRERTRSFLCFHPNLSRTKKSTVELKKTENEDRLMKMKTGLQKQTTKKITNGTKSPKKVRKPQVK